MHLSKNEKCKNPKKSFACLNNFYLPVFGSPCMAQDPTGAKTGTLSDIDTMAVKVLDTVVNAKDTTAKAVSATVSKLATAVQTIGAADGHNKIGINIVWTLITGFLVMFMQAGFALVETGFTQKKNAAHVMAMNFMVYGIGMFGFWVCGFAFMFGGAWGHPPWQADRELSP